MLTVFFAKLVGDALSYSIYDTHIKIRGAPVLVRHCLVCCVGTHALALLLQLLGAVSKTITSFGSIAHCVYRMCGDVHGHSSCVVCRHGW